MLLSLYVVLFASKISAGSEVNARDNFDLEKLYPYLPEYKQVTSTILTLHEIDLALPYQNALVTELDSSLNEGNSVIKSKTKLLQEQKNRLKNLEKTFSIDWIKAKTLGKNHYDHELRVSKERVPKTENDLAEAESNTVLLQENLDHAKQELEKLNENERQIAAARAELQGLFDRAFSRVYVPEIRLLQSQISQGREKIRGLQNEISRFSKASTNIATALSYINSGLNYLNAAYNELARDIMNARAGRPDFDPNDFYYRFNANTAQSNLNLAAKYIYDAANNLPSGYLSGLEIGEFFSPTDPFGYGFFDNFYGDWIRIQAVQQKISQVTQTKGYILAIQNSIRSTLFSKQSDFSSDSARLKEYGRQLIAVEVDSFEMALSQKGESGNRPVVDADVLLPLN